MYPMESTTPTLTLPEHLLDLADVKGLVVEYGAVLFESDIGGGLITHNWLTQQEKGICISTEILKPVEGSELEYEELMAATLSDPIEEDRAAEIIERWGLLHQLEVSFDAQKVKQRRPRKEHDSDMANDNL